MGNGMNKVMPGLFIGNIRDAKDTGQLSEHNITHILAIHDDARPLIETLIYKCIDVADSPGQNIADYFHDSIEFIHNARKDGGNVLVHCIAGVSRSCTICAAYIVTVANIGWSDAISVVRSARSIVNPNYGFQKQLQTFHDIESEKVRGALTNQYGEFDPADIQFIKDVAANLDQTDKSVTIDVNLALGATPAFGNYERKKNNRAESS